MARSPSSGRPAAAARRDPAPWYAAAAAAGLAAAGASSWVHYRLIQDPTYASFCDVSTTFSCANAYASSYGTVAGVSVAVIGVVYFGFLLALVALCARSASARANLSGYVLAASTAGLAAVAYFAYVSYFVIETICLLCLGSYAAVAALVVVSARAPRFPMSELSSRATRDLRLLGRTPSAMAAAAAVVAAAAAVIVLFPAPPVSAASAASGETGDGAQAATPAAQVQQLEQFLSGQPRVPILVPDEGAAVVIVKFNDYMCPPCRQTYLEYKPVFAKYEKSHPGKVRFVTRDFPLDPECNRLAPNGTHLASCEAAVAVRLARERGRGPQMEEWIFANQPTLTPQRVRDAARMIAGVADYDARYAATLEMVRGDVAQGGQLQVQATPTFFMNGIRLPGLRAEFFDAAIAWELRRVGTR